MRFASVGLVPRSGTYFVQGDRADGAPTLGTSHAQDPRTWPPVAHTALYGAILSLPEGPYLATAADMGNGLLCQHSPANNRGRPAGSPVGSLCGQVTGARCADQFQPRCPASTAPKQRSVARPVAPKGLLHCCARDRYASIVSV